MTVVKVLGKVELRNCAVKRSIHILYNIIGWGTDAPVVIIDFAGNKQDNIDKRIY